MTDLLDGVAAVLLLGVLNAVLIARMGSSQPRSEGVFLARQWRGESVGTSLTQALSGYGYAYLVAALYCVFGRKQFLVQLLNGTTGAVAVLVVYAIAARPFGRSVTRWLALFMAFFPQMVFWSAGKYKDPTILLCTAVCMYAVLRLREGEDVTTPTGALRALLVDLVYLLFRPMPAEEQAQGATGDREFIFSDETDRPR